jgi:hypothetical protein
MRDVCSTKLLNTSPDLGGPGVVVQIDESLNTKEADDQTKKHGSSGSPTHPPQMIQRRKIQWKNWQEVNPWRLKLSTT